MSEENRPKLNAKRFSKAKSSALAPKIAVEEKDDRIKRGLKRTLTEEEDDGSSKRTRIYASSRSVLPSCSTKNSANDRLKKLREELQTSNTHLLKNSPTEITNTREDFEEVGGKNISVKNTSTRKFDDKFTKSNQPCTKNTANSRLEKIRKKIREEINHNDNTSDLCDRKKDISEGNIHCSPMLKETTTTGIKRKINNATNIIDNDPENKVASKKLARLVPEPSGICENKLQFLYPWDKNSPNIKYSDGSGKTGSKSTTPNVADASSAQYNIPATSNTFVANREAAYIKDLPTGSEIRGNANTSHTVNSDNFNSKMARTVSWIKSHHNITDGVNNSPIPSTAANNVNLSKIDRLDDTEEMEWSNAEPDHEVIDPSKNEKDNVIAESGVKKDPDKSKDLCIVVDTNVFISGLSKIRDIVDMKVPGPIKPVIYIPWMVITELDYMKDSCSNSKLKKSIISSIHFINTALKENNPKVKGQTVFDMEYQKQIGPTPDDKIISCCIQVAEKYENVILLSNDLNLKNKAMIHDIVACSAQEIVMKILSRLTKNRKCKKVVHKMSILCSSVICECAKDTFGDIWKKMDMLNNAPWSLAECLKRFRKYWETVFKEKLMKQFTKTVDDLLNLISDNKYLSDDSEDFVEFMKLCITLCIFLKDIEECRGFVENSLAEITKLE